jgi:hypothetical protein
VGPAGGSEHGTSEPRRIEKAKKFVAASIRMTIFRISKQRCTSSSDEELREWLRNAWIRASKAQQQLKSGS